MAADRSLRPPLPFCRYRARQDAAIAGDARSIAAAKALLDEFTHRSTRPQRIAHLQLIWRLAGDPACALPLPEPAPRSCRSPSLRSQGASRNALTPAAS